MTNKSWVNSHDMTGNKREVEFFLTGGDTPLSLSAETVKLWLGEPTAVELIGDPSSKACRQVLIYKSSKRTYGLDALVAGYMPGWVVPDYPVTIPVAEFLSNTGSTLENGRLAVEGKDGPGYLMFGPYMPIPSGRFQITASVHCQGLSTQDGANWDIGYSDPTNQQFVKLAGANIGAESPTIDTQFDIAPPVSPDRIEFRVFYPGKGSLQVSDVQLKRVAQPVNMADSSSANQK